MIFDGTTEEKNYVKSYWLASPGVFFNSGNAYFGAGTVYDGRAFNGDGYLFHTDGYWDVCELTVRPVISLKSGVTVEDIKEISGTEEEWTYEKPKVSTPLESGNIQEGQIGNE